MTVTLAQGRDFNDVRLTFGFLIHTLKIRVLAISLHPLFQYPISLNCRPSVFNSEQKAKIRNGYSKCATNAKAYMEENGNALWNEWQESQTE